MLEIKRSLLELVAIKSRKKFIKQYKGHVIKKNELYQTRKISLILLIIFSFVFCKNNSNLTVEIDKSSVMDCFPLQVGNTWIYQLSAAGNALDGKILTITIVNKESFNSKIYYLFKSDFPSIESPWDSALFRISDQQVFRRINGKDYLWYDFGSRKDQSWKVPIRESSTLVTLEAEDDSVSVPAGSFVNCYRFHFFEGYDAQWHEHFAPKVGLLAVSYATLAGLNCHLKGATINSVSYP